MDDGLMYSRAEEKSFSIKKKPRPRNPYSVGTQVERLLEKRRKIVFVFFFFSSSSRSSSSSSLLSTEGSRHSHSVSLSLSLSLPSRVARKYCGFPLLLSSSLFFSLSFFNRFNMPFSIGSRLPKIPLFEEKKGGIFPRIFSFLFPPSFSFWFSLSNLLFSTLFGLFPTTGFGVHGIGRVFLEVKAGKKTARRF